MLDKTYRPAEVEAKHYRIWEQGGAFAAGRRPDADPYCIVIPPPNVTGSLHMGHALNNTLQDILIRFERMRGRDALWQPGMDHAGIATQMVVERRLEREGTSRRQLGRDKFIEKVWDWKQHSGGTITGQLRRLGASCDWDRERFTMDQGLSDAVRKVFVDLYKQGLIYRDQRLVNWDPKLRTAISDLEVQQQQVQGFLWHLKYPIEDSDDEYIIVATTRPETMLGDTAVAVHPDDARHAHLVGRHAILPLVGRRLPIIADVYVDPEQGSGALKITPAHDFNDFEVGRRHRLETVNVLDEAACINEHAPEAYRGLDRMQARRRVVDDLKAQGLVVQVENHVHMVPHGDRSGVPIEPYLTDQWYVDAATLAKPAIAAVEEGKTRFVPENWAKTYFEWMRNIQPWCVSRQIWWGHQIPAWYGPDGQVFVELTEAAAKAAARAHYDAEVDLRQDPDVLDTWFSSALWPFSTLGWPESTPALARYYPTDVLVTGFDIIFFWVARMMMMGLHFLGEAPFHTVYIHALVRDQRGQKMSKSKGNIIDPLALIDAYGADSLRFTLAAMAAQGRDMKLSEARVEGYRNFGTKLWNAARFCQMNGCEPDPAFDPASCRLTINKWIVGGVVALAGRVTRELESYRFNEAAGALYQFTWGTFCDWYVEFAKPILNGEDAAARGETAAAAAWALDRILCLLHPFMPFLTEELWDKLAPGGVAARGTPLITAPWPRLSADLIDRAAAQEMDWVVRLIGQIRAVRGELNVPSAARIAMRLRGASPVNAARFETHHTLITRLARLGTAELSQAEPPPDAIQLVLDEAVVVLPLADVIDIARERTRLEKQLDKVAADKARLEHKLSNRQFLDKAPEDVVAEQRQRRDDFAATESKLRAALARIKAA
jgi:valyl-tRNA synthetase